MPYRRKRGQEGLVGDLVEMIKVRPVIGWIVGGLMVVLGAVLNWGLAGSGTYGGIFGLIGVGGMGLGGLLILMTLGSVVLNRLESGERKARLEGVGSVDDLMKMDWREFEGLVADLFRRQGFRVTEVGDSADGGVDLVLEKQGLEQLVQCKQYRSWSVGEPKVREFYGAMAAYETRCEGIIVTCGEFTQPARAFASGKAIRLVNGAELVEMLSRVNPIRPAAEVGSPGAQPASEGLRTKGTDPEKLCPACGSTMVRRRAKKGSGAGKEFWGCSSYPTCRKSQPIT